MAYLIIIDYTKHTIKMSPSQSPYFIHGGSLTALPHSHSHGKCHINLKSCNKGPELSRIIRQEIGFEGVGKNCLHLQHYQQSSPGNTWGDKRGRSLHVLLQVILQSVSPRP